MWREGGRGTLPGNEEGAKVPPSSSSSSSSSSSLPSPPPPPPTPPTPPTAAALPAPPPLLALVLLELPAGAREAGREGEKFTRDWIDGNR